MDITPSQISIDEQKLCLERLALIFKGAGIAAYINTAIAALSLFVFWPHSPAPHLFLWFGALVFFVSIRSFMALIYDRQTVAKRQKHLVSWKMLLIGISASIGFCWGLMGLLFSNPGMLELQVFSVFVAGGMVIGAITVNSYYLPAFTSYMVPAILPLIIHFLILGDSRHITMAGMLTVFCLGVFFFTRNLGHTFQSLLRLEHQQTGLLEKLERTQKSLAYALQSRSEGFAIFDSDDRLALFNERFRENMGLYKSDIKIGDRFEDIMLEVSRILGEKQAGEPDLDWLEKRMEYHRNPQGPFENFAAGRWFLVNEFRTPDGNTVGVQTDITELKAREAQLRESEARKSGIMNSALDAMITIDADGRILEFNEAAEKMFGYRCEDVLQQEMDELIVPPELRDAHNSAMRRYNASGQSTILNNRRQFNIMRSDGSRFPAEITVSSVQTEQGELFTSFIRDISDQIMAERELLRARDEAERASQSKTEFLATMSHEIRTPMNGVLGTIDLILDTPLDERQLKFARTAKEAGEALRMLLNDLLDFSKIEAGKLELEMAAFDPGRILNGVVDIVLPGAETKGLEVITQQPEDLPARLIGDRGRLRQILLNFASNAIKFTDAGWIKISAQVVERSGNTAHVRFQVDDTGIGINDKFKKRIFGKFSQADPTIARKHGGSGLGLAISQRLVQLMRGEIGFNSTFGNGSSFWTILPFEIAADDTVLFDQPDAPENLINCELMGARILLVDDSAVNRMVTGEILRNAGAVVFEAESGPEAIAFMKEQAADVIFMDISMPKMDGLEATAHIRALGGAQTSIPVIALTAYATPEDRERFLANGMDDYVAKPVRRQTLLEAILRQLPGLVSATVATDKEEKIQTEEPYKNGIDAAVLKILEKEVGAEAVGQLLATFIREAEDRKNCIANLLESGAMTELEDHAHALKSAARSFGALELGKTCAALEKAARARSRDHYKALHDQFENQVLQAIRELQERVNETIAAE